MLKVVISQHRLLHYRVIFFEKLRSHLSANNIELHLLHGQPTIAEQQKRDTGIIKWADVVENRYITIGQKDILWQPFPRHLHGADLIVLMQENRLLSNYPWLFFRFLNKSKVAYWGHGRNFQTNAPDGLREKWKKFLNNRVDWWFAYTDMTRDILLQDNYPAERITVLNNAIDNAGFISDLSSVTEAHLNSVRNELGIGPNSKIGLFCGSLYPDKRLDFLVSVADAIHAEMPDFHLVVIGDGPSAEEISLAAQSRPWLHRVGVKRGVDKAAYFRLAHVVLNPGLVGLHILDSFCSGVPMVTTADAKHSPEIAYLKHEENGLIAPSTVGEFAQAVIGLLSNEDARLALSRGALKSSEDYTLDNMVTNFADGIEKCLSAPRFL